MTGIRPAAAAGTRGPCALAGRKYNRGLGQLAWHEQSTVAGLGQLAWPEQSTVAVATVVVATAVVATVVEAGKATAVALILVAVAAAVRVGRPQQGLVALA